MGKFMEEAARNKKRREAEAAARSTPEAIAARKARIKSVDDHLKGTKTKRGKADPVESRTTKPDTSAGSWRR